MNILTEPIKYNYRRVQVSDDRKHLSMRHTHNHYEIIFLESGDVTYVIEDRKYQLKKNDLVITRPLKYHYLELTSDEDYARHDILFDPSFVGEDSLLELPENLEVFHCPPDSILQDIFKRITYYGNVLSNKAFTDILSALVKELIYNLTLEAKKPTDITFKTSPFLTKVLEYINENLFTVKDIKDICKHFYISQQYFFRLFQTQLKITPHKYLNSKRLLYAQKMLQQGKKPTAVYLLCGFESYVGFYKQYIKTFGYSPSKELSKEKL
ncbi:MAG: helix-turn-helix transcriptional regulator [Clostridia bacterium]|nr:helix-turn-helix transcriptional regulator [Clostridia bacterium]